MKAPQLNLYFKRIYIAIFLLGVMFFAACQDTGSDDDDKPTRYTVSFELQREGLTAPEAQSIRENAKAQRPEIVKNATEAVVAWLADKDDESTAFDFENTAITKNITLYAKWKVAYTVTFKLNYDGAASNSLAVETGKTTTKPADPTRDGYIFGGWYEKQQDGSYTAFHFDTTPITKDTTLYAKWICLAREAREKLTPKHVVPLYNQGEADAPYLPKALRGTFADDSHDYLYFLSRTTITAPAGQEDQLPYISPYPSIHVPSDQASFVVNTGGFEITPDHIDASFTDNLTPSNATVRISCYSMKQVNDSLYFYYGKVKFLFGGKETEGNNKLMYAWTGIDKRDDANKDALYGYMVSIQGDYLRPLYVYPFVGGTYTASDGKTVNFPKTEAEYAALTLEDLNIIATGKLTSELLFSESNAGFLFNRPAGIYTGPGGN